MNNPSGITLPPRHRLISGAGAFTALLVLYCASLLVSSAHNTALQLVAIWGLVLLFWRRGHVPLARWEWAVLFSTTATFAVAVLSYAVNDLWQVPEGNLSRYARFLLFVPLYFVARRFATAQGFWLAALCGGVVAGTWGLLEFLEVIQHPKDNLPFSVNGAVNPIQFGDLSLLFGMLIGAGVPVYRSWGRWCVGLAGLAIALNLFGCLTSDTRGAWVSAPLLLLINAMHLVHMKSISRLQLLAIAAVGLTGLVIAMQLTDVSRQWNVAVREINDYRQGKVGPSVGTRFELWRASWAVYKTEPVLGVGPGMYGSRIRALAESGQYHKRALRFSHPHSEYVFVMVTLGTVGLIAAGLLWGVPLLIFLRALRRGIVEQQSLAVAGILVVVGYVQFGLTEALMFQHATFLGFYFMSIAVLVGLLERSARNGRAETPA